MVSLICRLKGSAAAAGILRSPFLPRLCFYGRARMSSSSSSSVDSPSKLSAPALMLPPQSFKAGDTNNFKLYHLAENRIEDLPVELPNDAVLVGSSHGWLAFFNQSNNHLFLSNPISGRHLNLPPIDPLPNPVSKVILSCSPDDEEEEECQAVVSFGPGDRLAVCCSGRSPAHWNPVGRYMFREKSPWEYTDGDGPYPYYGWAYEDFSYRSKRKLISCITQFVIDLDYWIPSLPSKLEHLEQREDECSTLRVCRWMWFDYEKCSWLMENKKLLRRACLQIPYLVYAEQSDRLFIVVRYINSVDPHNTVGFCVGTVDFKKNGEVEKVRLAYRDEDASLDGLSLFVGTNHSFAVSSAAEFGLEPNSIYFTDAFNNTRLTHPSNVRGLDIGIFNYENKTLSPFPCSLHDYHQTLSTPVWFTPSK